MYVNLAKNASVVDSTCTTGNQIIHINFTVDGASKPYTLTFNFTQDDDKYYMETLTLNFLADSGLYPLYARAGRLECFLISLGTEFPEV